MTIDRIKEFISKGPSKKRGITALEFQKKISALPTTETLPEMGMSGVGSRLEEMTQSGIVSSIAGKKYS